MRDLMSEDEKKLISQRTREVMQYLISEGRFTGRAPRGYTFEVREDGKKYLIPDVQEFEDMELVKSWKRQGYSFGEMIAMCEARGIKSRSGRTPSQSTISYWTKGVEGPEKPKAKPKTTNPNLFGRRARPRLENKIIGLWPLIESLLEQGLSHSKIALRVESAGYRTSKGKPIQQSQITRIIKRKRGYKRGSQK